MNRVYPAHVPKDGAYKAPITPSMIMINNFSQLLLISSKQRRRTSTIKSLSRF